MNSSVGYNTETKNFRYNIVPGAIKCVLPSCFAVSYQVLSNVCYLLVFQTDTDRKLRCLLISKCRNRNEHVLISLIGIPHDRTGAKTSAEACTSASTKTSKSTNTGIKHARVSHTHVQVRAHTRTYRYGVTHTHAYARNAHANTHAVTRTYTEDNRTYTHIQPSIYKTHKYTHFQPHL